VKAENTMTCTCRLHHATRAWQAFHRALNHGAAVEFSCFLWREPWFKALYFPAAAEKHSVFAFAKI